MHLDEAPESELAILADMDQRTIRQIPTPEGIGRSKPVLGEAIKYLSEQEFNPDQIRYDSPLENAKPTYDELHDWAMGLRDFESAVLTAAIEEGLASRITTGSSSTVNWHHLFPRGRDLDVGGTGFKLRTVWKMDKYPILDEQGKTSDQEWHAMIHNQPDDGIPSPGDSRVSFGIKNNLIVSPEGLTVFSKPTVDVKDLPREVVTEPGASLEKQFTTQWFQIRLIEYLQKSGKVKPKDQYKSEEEYKRVSKLEACKLLGVEVRVIPWEDREEIEQVLDEIYGTT